jgi:hypothetical protein
MNLQQAINRHEDKAALAARLGKAKLARAHKLRAEQLRTAKQIKRELRQ